MEFHFRSAVLLTFFALWALIAAVTLYHRTVVNGELLTENSESVARKEGVLPAARGRILDANGVPLAWTEMRFSLYLHKSPNGISSRLKNFLAEEFQIFSIPDFSENAESLLLKDELPVHTEKDLAFYLSLPETYPQLSVRTVHKRIRVDYPQIADLLGTCQDDAEGVPHGVSGWEKEFDSTLCGTAGTFTVMRDRNGKWMPGTMKMTKMPIPGEDVKLSLTLEELLRQAEAD